MDSCSLPITSIDVLTSPIRHSSLHSESRWSPNPILHPQWTPCHFYLKADREEGLRILSRNGDGIIWERPDGTNCFRMRLSGRPYQNDPEYSPRRVLLKRRYVGMGLTTTGKEVASSKKIRKLRSTLRRRSQKSFAAKVLQHNTASLVGGLCRTVLLE